MAHPDDLITQLVNDVGFDHAINLLSGPPGTNSIADRLVEWIGAAGAIEDVRELLDEEKRQDNGGWIDIGIIPLTNQGP